MSTKQKIIKDDNELRLAFKPSPNPANNDYPIVVKDHSVNYAFKFPLSGNQFTDHESTQAFNIGLGQEYSLRFEGCTFEDPITLYFSPEKPNRDIFFLNCTFKKRVSINSYKKIATFSKCTFEEVFAKNSLIEGKMRFWECDFEGFVNFRNTRFEGLADFWRSKFHKTMIFYKTDFMNTVVFSATTFEENVLFTYTLIDKLILFRGTKIKKGFDLSLAIIQGKLGLFEFNLKDFKEVEFFDNEQRYEDAVSIHGVIPINNKRETFRILKDNLESQKNLSESLKFKAIEKEVLRRELIKKSTVTIEQSWWNTLKSKTNNRLERLNLWLNKISNDHGDSYGRAFLFIVVIGWVWFYSSLIASDQFYFTLDYTKWCFGDGLILFLEFLNPIHKWDFIEKDFIQPNVWFYLFDFFGKISIGYGIYQFVQAFRKYK